MPRGEAYAFGRFLSEVNETLFQARVRSNREVDLSEIPDPVGPIDPSATAPAKMAGPSFEARETSGVATWTAPDDGGDAITGYDLRYKQAPNILPESDPDAGWTDWDFSGTALTTTLTGLTTWTLYYVQMRAVNRVGNGEWSDTVYVRPRTASLYAVGRSNNLLYAVDKDDASGRIIRLALQRGLQISGARGLAWDGSTLFVVGGTTRGLYTVNIHTGMATLVGDPGDFGVTADPQGLAWDGTNLYMVTFSQLFTVNRTTGVATLVADLTQPSGFIGVGATGLAWDGSTMFVVDRRHDILATLNLSTGDMTRVGTAIRFGVSATSPEGLAWDGDDLYMVDQNTDRLYTVSRTTGIATQVGTTTRFGANETFPSGLAYVDTPAPAPVQNTAPAKMAAPSLESENAALAVAWIAPSNGGSVITDYDVRYKKSADSAWIDWPFSGTGLSTTITGLDNGSAYDVQVRAVNAVGNGEYSDSASETPAAPVMTGNLYMVGGDNDALYTLNRTTGVATQVGSATDFGLSEELPRAIAYDGSTLFMLGQTTRALYTLNLSTGIATRVGSASNFGVSEFEPRGLAWDGTNLFMVGDSGSALYTLNRTTGVATKVGTATRFGLSEGGVPGALAWDGSTLYMLDRHTAALHTLNRTTGVATRVGTANAFGVSENEPSGLAWDGTNLYMTGWNTDNLHTLNRTTGVATRVGTSSQFGVSEGNPEGLAFA